MQANYEKDSQNSNKHAISRNNLKKKKKAKKRETKHRYGHAISRRQPLHQAKQMQGSGFEVIGFLEMDAALQKNLDN